jgi:hypothetical protein
MLDALWTDPARSAIMETIDTAAIALHDATRWPRNGVAAWPREFQFAAVGPLKKRRVMLGLAEGGMGALLTAILPMAPVAPP